MKPRHASYTPPVLNLRVRLRDPSAEPPGTRDRLGRLVGDGAEWGDEIWAARRDRRPETDEGEDRESFTLTTVWTIRWRAGVAADARILYNGDVFESVGPPREMGGAGYGRATRYLEIHTILRK